MRNTKRICALLLVLCLLLTFAPFKASASGDIAISAANFPDVSFCVYLLNMPYGEDRVLTQEEIADIIIMNVSSKEIFDLTGIEHFTALQTLFCDGNSLSELDVSHNTELLDLICNDNRLDSLDVSQNTKLQNLYCYNNELTSLDLSHNADLKELQCHYNMLSSLDVSKNTDLEYLRCEMNQLQELNVSGCTKLSTLSCSVNKLTGLDVSQNTALTSLSCFTNAITGLDVSSNPALATLDCSGNQLTSLDLSINAALVALNCSTNPLGNLDVSNNTALRELTCDRNQLTSLDVSKNTALVNLYCDNNQLTNLDVSKNTALKKLRCNYNQFTGLDVSRNGSLVYLSCGNNQLTELDVSQNAKLTDLSCDYNKLTALDVSKNTALDYLYCTGNLFTDLDVSQNPALEELYCGGNQLTNLDVSNNAALERLHCDYNQLTSLDLSNNPALTELYCHKNQLTSLDVRNNTALTTLYCKDNSYTIELDSRGQYDLSNLPGDFDLDKASDWTGGTVSGNILTAESETITYTYQIAEDRTETFTLNCVLITRLAGANRWETAVAVADQLKLELGVEKFDTIIIASGSGFADALSGSYLAAVKNAPILLSWNGDAKYEYLNQYTVDYVKATLKEGGTVYILGGTSAVPEHVDAMLAGYSVVRLAGENRFETNLLILEEAGVKSGEDILVCTGSNFADSLSASATGNPILLVNSDGNQFYRSQIDFVLSLENCRFVIIGGESAVSWWIEHHCLWVCPRTRLEGENRFETSVLVAERFFPEAESAVLAYAWNYPDGLCGGPLAYVMGAPLILTMDGYESQAAAYVQEMGIRQCYVLGSDELISDSTVNTIFAME